MKEFSSDVVETSLSTLPSVLKVASGGNTAAFTSLHPILCMNSELIHPLPLLLSLVYAYNTSMLNPCWSLYSNRIFFSENAALCLGDKKISEVKLTLLRNSLSIAPVSSSIYKSLVGI